MFSFTSNRPKVWLLYSGQPQGMESVRDRPPLTAANISPSDVSKPEQMEGNAGATPLLHVTGTFHPLWLVKDAYAIGSPLAAGDRPAAAANKLSIDRLIMLVPRKILRCKPVDPAMQVDAIRGTSVSCAYRYRRCGNCATGSNFREL